MHYGPRIVRTQNWDDVEQPSSFQVTFLVLSERHLYLLSISHEGDIDCFVRCGRQIKEEVVVAKHVFG